MPGMLTVADQFRMALDERVDAVRLGRLADGRGDVERVEIAGVDEAVHGAEADVVGIDVVGLLPARSPHRRVGRGAHARRFGADDGVLAVRFVPDGDDVDAVVRRHHAGPQLGLGLMRETVADTEGEFFQGKHDEIHPNYNSIADANFRNSTFSGAKRFFA